MMSQEDTLPRSSRSGKSFVSRSPMPEFASICEKHGKSEEKKIDIHGIMCGRHRQSCAIGIYAV